MITFSKFGQLGRFGNQLFQYAAARSLSIHTGDTLGIPISSKNIKFHGQDNLMTKLNIPEEYFVKKNFFYYLFKKKFIEPKAEVIYKNFYDLDKNIDLNGYFQSIFYFKDHVGLIKKELMPKNKYLNKASNIINEIKKKNKGHSIVSLHLRRGDNVDPNIKGNSKSLVNSYGKNDSDFDKSDVGRYVFNALSKFKNKRVKFLIFSGGGRENDDNSSDLDWCKRVFTKSNFIINKPQSSFDDFCQIMCCDHNIISKASSFGWWAAFLGESLSSKKKIIIAPFYYNSSNPREKNKIMFYPKSWNVVK